MDGVVILMRARLLTGRFADWSNLLACHLATGLEQQLK